MIKRKKQSDSVVGVNCEREEEERKSSVSITRVLHQIHVQTGLFYD